VQEEWYQFLLDENVQFTKMPNLDEKTGFRYVANVRLVSPSIPKVRKAEGLVSSRSGLEYLDL
jgi:hypothetical protein